MRSGLALLVSLGAFPAAAHDWYTELKAPDGQRCCSERDCQRVDQRYNTQLHRLEIGIDGLWVPVDTSKLVTVPSADGEAHACFERHWMLNKMTPVIRCIILPGEV